LPVAILGSGSDYTVFFNRLGISSADLVFDGPYGVYHSVYDTYGWMASVGDPGFRYHAGMARMAGLLALRFANADVLPFDAAAYGREIARYAEQLRPGAAPAESEALSALARRARAWSAAAAEAAGNIGGRLASGRITAGERAGANAWLLSLERAMCDGGGLPRRPWFRHLIYAPLPSYKAETLPAIREALADGGVASPAAEIERLGRKLDAATAAARRLSGPPAARPSPTPRRR
jgi:N-acetylated-alpha-linked acidic dipeptidase